MALRRGLTTTTKAGNFTGKCTNKNAIGIEVCSTNSTRKNAERQRQDIQLSRRRLCATRSHWKAPHEEVQASLSTKMLSGITTATGKLCPGHLGWNAKAGRGGMESSRLDLGNVQGSPQKKNVLCTGRGVLRKGKRGEVSRRVPPGKNYPQAFIKIM